MKHTIKVCFMLFALLLCWRWSQGRHPRSRSPTSCSSWAMTSAGCSRASTTAA